MFVCTNRQIQKFIFLQSRIKICFGRYEKIWLVVLLLFLHAKLQLTRVLYANHQTCANRLLVSMLVRFISTQCVNHCLLDCIRDGSTILKLRDSQLAKTNLAPLRKWFRRTSNKVDQIAELRVMSLLVDKRKMVASIYMEFFIIVTLFLKQWVDISTTVHVKKLARPWQATKLWEG